VAKDYTQISAGYKWSYGGGPWDVAIIYDQPFGADIDYPVTTTYPLRGSTATFDSNAITILTKYKLDGGMSVFGGLKAQTVKMDVALPVLGYTASGANEQGFGYVVGAAYERPEIALRAALTYHSAIDYSIGTTENGSPSRNTDVTTPQSVNLDFQTGIAADTLLFGSARWVNWKAFDVSPFGYINSPANPTGAALVSYTENTINFSAGIGRKFSEQWSGAVTIGFEPSGGGFQSNLGPTDGKRSLGVGGTYTNGNMKVTAGAQYILAGDAKTVVSSTGPVTSSFTDNSAVAIGLKVGFSM
jgi:long-subunit fatty acid transport protein